MRWQIAPDGWFVLASFGLVTIILGVIHVPLGTLALGLMMWLTYVMRVPTRTVPLDAKAIVAPADGRVVAIDVAPLPGNITDAAGNPNMATRITIKTSLADAHLQVVPMDGRIVENFLIPGLFLALDDMDAVRNDNERREIIIENENENQIVIVQYGGRYARHLVCNVGTGKFVTRGSPLGMIRMAGITDIFVPAAATAHVAVGQTVLAGETIVASIKMTARATATV